MNRGFLYGDGFFETIRVHQGNIPLLEYHLKRIDEALAIYQLEPAFAINLEFIENIARSYNFSEGIIRINFFREGAGKYLPETNTVGFSHSGTETDRPFRLPTSLDIFKDLKQLNVNKGIIEVYKEPKSITKHLTVKSLSSAFYVLAALSKKAQDIDYLLLTNNEGHILEELSSNILIQNKDILLMPPLEAGQVVGATLRYLLANYSGEIIEQHFTLEEALDAKAIYLAQGTTGIRCIL